MYAARCVYSYDSKLIEIIQTKDYNYLSNLRKSHIITLTTNKENTFHQLLYNNFLYKIYINNCSSKILLVKATGIFNDTL